MQDSGFTGCRKWALGFANTLERHGRSFLALLQFRVDSAFWYFWVLGGGGVSGSSKLQAAIGSTESGGLGTILLSSVRKSML